MPGSRDEVMEQILSGGTADQGLVDMFEPRGGGYDIKEHQDRCPFDDIPAVYKEPVEQVYLRSEEWAGSDEVEGSGYTVVRDLERKGYSVRNMLMWNAHGYAPPGHVWADAVDALVDLTAGQIRNHEDSLDDLMVVYGNHNTVKDHLHIHASDTTGNSLSDIPRDSVFVVSTVMDEDGRYPVVAESRGNPVAEVMLPVEQMENVSCTDALEGIYAEATSLQMD